MANNNKQNNKDAKGKANVTKLETKVKTYIYKGGHHSTNPPPVTTKPKK